MSKTAKQLLKEFNNFKQQYNEEDERDEHGRRASPNISYEVSADKVIANLKSFDSQSYTKLAQKIDKVSTLEAEVKQLKEEIKQDTRENIHDLFAAEDAVRTRVVETLQFVFTLSKDPKPTETYKYANIIDELSQHLTPELIKMLEDLKSKYKSTVQKPPSLKVKPLDEGIGDSISSYWTKFKQFVERWGQQYDTKLDKLKQQAGI